MWGQDGWRSHRLVSYRARYLRLGYILFFYAPIEARILFEAFFGVEGVESSKSCAKEFRHLGWASLFYHNSVSQVGTYSRSAGQLQVFVQAYHTPSSVRQQRFNCYHTPKHTLWMFGRPITPPLVYHTPLGPPASCTLSSGVHKISHPPQDTTPGDHIFKSQNVITGVCYLMSVTVFVSGVLLASATS